MGRRTEALMRDPSAALEPLAQRTGGLYIQNTNNLTEGFARITAELARLGLPTVLVQEGGYLSPDLGPNLGSALAGFEQAA